jgi:ribose-phosphate pyrophosphokinase
MIKLNGFSVPTIRFPGGELGVNIGKLLSFGEEVILAQPRNSDEIMMIPMIVDALRRIRGHTIPIVLQLLYTPYARQDRVCNFGESLSIKVFADLINSLELQTVRVYDPHSDVTSALINRSSIVGQDKVVTDYLLRLSYQKPDPSSVFLVSPDAGAEKKILAVSKALGRPWVTYATKVRDSATGEITSVKLINEVQPNKTAIIVDDICDGGATFVALAKCLKEVNVKDIKLFVTHGIFSKGLSPLKEHFSEIRCLHTFLPNEQLDPSFLKVSFKND